MADDPAQMQLLDLPEDVLLGQILAQLPFRERLHLSLVCRRLRSMCARSSPLWRIIEARVWFRNDAEEPDVELRASMSGFRRWLTPRAAGVEDLTVRCRQTHTGLLIDLPADLLPSAADAPAMPLLRRLAILWQERAHFSLHGAPALPALCTLWLSGVRLEVPGPADHLPQPSAAIRELDLGLFHGSLIGYLGAAAWLPSGVTQLRLMDLGLDGLPELLRHLPQLRSLGVDANGRLAPSSFPLLEHLTGLEALDLGENELPRFPHEVSALVNLRILFLHKCFTPESALAEEDWECLRPLRRLVFLSISGKPLPDARNHLRELPPGVAALSRLRGLHIEDNLMRRPLGTPPCFANLLELLVDWGDALRSPAAIAAATRLTRLVLNNHLASAWQEDMQFVPPAAMAEPLLAALAAHPSLRCVEDVVEEGNITGLTPPVAKCMWELPRRCPNVQAICTIDSTYIGWSLGSMPAEAAAAAAAAAADAEEGDERLAAG